MHILIWIIFITSYFVSLRECNKKINEAFIILVSLDDDQKTIIEKKNNSDKIIVKYSLLKFTLFIYLIIGNILYWKIVF